MQTKVISCVICALMIATVLMIEIPKDVSAQVTEEWVAKYNGPANGWDDARDIAVDTSGNVYITGYSQEIMGISGDFTTVKYDSNGNEIWVVRYNGPGSDTDRPAAIALDSLENIYVTGLSIGSGTSWDYATIKYDSSGNELWVRRYDGPCNGADDARAIAVDEFGNVYVTGGSLKTGKDLDYVTIKYDTNGNELWIARYDSQPGDFGDYAQNIALDSSGNVYVTGYSIGNGTDRDCTTVKYDSNGNELWASRYNGPGNLEDYALDIATDSIGNVYITGASYGIGTHSDFATIKYDTDGNEQWIVKYNGPGNNNDLAHGLVIDQLGNVYVTGHSYDNLTFFDTTTIAYDSSGNTLWVVRYNGPGNDWDCGRNIAIDDTSGDIYITGDSCGNGTYYDAVTIAYDSSGNERWVARFNDFGNIDDGAQAIALDPFGNVYITGYSRGNNVYPDYVTIKYSQEKPNLQVTIDIDPDTLNLKSKGRWITCYIDLPGNDVNEIDISTILLEDTIPAEWGDIQNETLMVKFDRSEVEDMLSPGTYNLKVSGELMDGTEFEGHSDEIRVIGPG